MSGAQLSRQLGIPYLVEYNGSEVSMMRSFGNGGYTQADLFELIEEAAFAQALVVSVVSQPIADFARSPRCGSRQDPRQPQRSRPRRVPPGIVSRKRCCASRTRVYDRRRRHRFHGHFWRLAWRRGTRKGDPGCGFALS